VKNIAILISDKGTGTNLQAIIDAVEKGRIHGKIAVVTSNTSRAFGLERAKNYNIPTEVFGWKKYKEEGRSRGDYSGDLSKLLKDKYRVDVVALAGWSLILTREFFQTFPNAVLNIHPGLLTNEGGDSVISPSGEKLPANVGMMTDEAIKRFLYGGYKYAGSTLHFATEEADAGPVIFHEFEKIKPTDTVGSLYSRLKKKEHSMFIKALSLFCDNKLTCEDMSVKVIQ
jgi:phosphoribosylglycinamide formyltransferase-1